MMNNKEAVPTRRLRQQDAEAIPLLFPVINLDRLFELKDVVPV